MAILNDNGAAVEGGCHKTGDIALVGLDGTLHMQVAESGIAHIAEGSHETPVENTSVKIDCQRMAVSVEDTTVGNILSPADAYVATVNVGIEAGVYVVFTLGSSHLFAKGHPVISRTDGEEMLRNLVFIVQRRLVAVYI